MFYKGTSFCWIEQAYLFRDILSRNVVFRGLWLDCSGFRASPKVQEAIKMGARLIVESQQGM